MARPKSKHSMVRMTLLLSTDTKQAIDRLQKKTGRASAAEVIRTAIKLYEMLEDDDKEVYLKNGQTTERLIVI